MADRPGRAHIAGELRWVLVPKSSSKGELVTVEQIQYLTLGHRMNFFGRGVQETTRRQARWRICAWPWSAGGCLMVGSPALPVLIPAAYLLGLLTAGEPPPGGWR